MLVVGYEIKVPVEIAVSPRSFPESENEIFHFIFCNIETFKYTEQEKSIIRHQKRIYTIQPVIHLNPTRLTHFY